MKSPNPVISLIVNEDMKTASVVAQWSELLSAALQPESHGTVVRRVYGGRSTSYYPPGDPTVIE